MTSKNPPDGGDPVARPPIRILDVVPGTSFRDAALAFYAAGFAVIPLVPGTKRSAVKWDGWLATLSPKAIRQHWMLHPDHELGCIVDARMLVLDADSAESLAALDKIERLLRTASNFVVKTRRGQHRYYRPAKGTIVKTNAHSTEAHPKRVDVKAKRSLVVLPPSTDKAIEHCGINTVDDLTEVDQTFVDAVYRHNGLEPPRAVPTPAVRPAPIGAVADGALAALRAKLGRLDPDMGYSDWLAVLMAVCHETGGSEEGFELVNEWSAGGAKYCGEPELRTKWLSFDGHEGPEVTEGTINAMLTKQGDDWREIAASAEPQFEACDYELVETDRDSIRKPNIGNAVASILEKYSITPKLEKLRQEEIEQRYVLDGIAMMGQATVLYASPNTGKTLLVLWLLIQSIAARRLDASKVFYVNCDDSLHGLLTKGAIARANGFHMIADGYEGFEIGKLREILLEVMDQEQARGTVIVLDTLKRFSDLMSKSSTSNFMKLIRRFVLRGGTVIMLAHANKRPDAAGKPIYAGVADILDDADCGFIMWVTSEAGAVERVVEFEMKKRRGNVLQHVTFTYSGADHLSYEQLLASVRRVDVDEAIELHAAAVLRADDPVIDGAKSCIREGICKRLELVAEIARRTNCGRRSAEAVLDKYTGSDLLSHHWNYRIGPRGAKVYYLLEIDPSDQKPEDKSPDY